MTLQLIVFIVLALFIAVCSVLAVTTSRILRAATYLLFVFIWYSRYLLPTQLLILGSCTITDLRRWYNSALCI